MVWRMLDVDYLSVVLISIPATVAYDFCPQQRHFLKAPRQSAECERTQASAASII